MFYCTDETTAHQLKIDEHVLGWWLSALKHELFVSLTQKKQFFFVYVDFRQIYMTDTKWNLKLCSVFNAQERETNVEYYGKLPFGVELKRRKNYSNELHKCD